jgi:hypothetical protein
VWLIDARTRAVMPKSATTAVSRLQWNDTITDHKILPLLTVTRPILAVSGRRRQHRTEVSPWHITATTRSSSAPAALV